MKRIAPSLVFALALAPLLSVSQTRPSPFLGRWDFNLTPSGAVWLGVTEKNGALDVWFQPTGGNVHQVKDFKANGSHMTLTVSAANAKNPAARHLLDFLNSAAAKPSFEKRGFTVLP